jgi:alanine racemase
MDRTLQLYDIYLRTFLLVRAGVVLTQTYYCGKSTGGGGTYKEYEGEDLAAVALGVRDGKLESNEPDSKADFTARLKQLMG